MAAKKKPAKDEALLARLRAAGLTRKVAVGITTAVTGAARRSPAKPPKAVAGVARLP